MSQDLVYDFLKEKAENPKYWTPKEIRDAIQDKFRDGESLSVCAIARQLRKLYDYKYLEVGYPSKSFWRPAYRYKRPEGILIYKKGS
jgi:hypothetical protein